jgi:hypothetical protein
MKIQSIHSAVTGAMLFEGRYDSFIDCLEQAVQLRVLMNGADLRNRNLSNACLDDGLFAGADFSGSNLTGANLSEAALAGACFENADLYNTCLAYTDLRGCRFGNANFGATDITGADLSQAHFAALSCFSLDFIHTAAMKDCRYYTEDNAEFTFSEPPIVIRGLGRRLVVMTDSFWLNGTVVIPCPEQFRPLLPPAEMAEFPG